MFLNLKSEFKEFLKLISTFANAENLRLFIVGGAVRDYYLNIPVKDFDLILEGNAIDFAAKLPSEISVKSVHKDFGTVKLIFKDMEFDLASTRTESYPYSGCLPVIGEIGVPIEVDVLRRDFTINSMYFEVLENLEFRLVDLVCGIDDFKQKKLKVLHPKSYIDDPTRIFRGIAFKNRFNFDFSDVDKNLIFEYLKNIDYSNMSTDRAVSVFKIALNNNNCFNILDDIIKFKAYRVITDNNIKFDTDLIKKIYRLFGFNNADFADLIEKIVKLEQVMPYEFKDKLSAFKIYSGLNKVNLAYLYYKTSDDIIVWYLKNKDVKLKVSGVDLINMGFKQGKAIGQILDSMLLFKLENPNKLLDFTSELEWIKSNFPIK